jgi:hypothetical protein
MKGEVMIDRIWDIWVKKGLVNPELKNEYLTEMNYLYAGGFDEGRKQVAHRKKVAKMDEFGNILERYESAQQAANKNGITKHMISKVCLGHNSKAGERRTGTGYLYKYIDDDEEIKHKGNDSK